MTEGALDRSYATGAALFRAGSIPPGVFVVVTGRVRVTRARDGRQYVVHSEGPGGTLAELPFFEQGPVPATAVALEPTRCLILTRAALREIMRDDPGVAWLFLQRLSGRVRSLLEKLDQASTQSVRARLAGYLLARATAERAGDFSLGMTQAQLAEELGTVREVLVRSLAQLRKAGAISSAARGRYRVANLAALRELTY